MSKQPQPTWQPMTQLPLIASAIDAILAAADELKGGTIEQVLAKSDEQLGLEFLLRRSSEQDC